MSLDEAPPIHVKKSVHAILEKLKTQLKRKGRVSFNDVIEYLIEIYDRKEVRTRQIQTDDVELKNKLPCVLRYQHKGWFWCGRKAPQRHKLHTLKQCRGCEHRLDEQAFLNLQQELTKQKLHAMQLSLNSTIQKHKDQLYPTCNPLERQGEYGYEIRSDKCPNDRLKEEWHPPDVCPLNCPFLKRVQIKNKVKQT